MLKSGSNEALRIIVNGYVNTVADATDATLSALSVSGATLSPAFGAATTTLPIPTGGEFGDPGHDHRDDKRGDGDGRVSRRSDATRTDADTMTAGFQRNLSVGTNTVKVKVTAPDTLRPRRPTPSTLLRVAVPVACSPASMTNRIWTGNLTVGDRLVLVGVLLDSQDKFRRPFDDTTFSYAGTELHN